MSYIPAIESNNEKQTSELRNEAFDPRNPETYQFATNNQLILDGILIYICNEYEDDTENTIRKQVSEKSFVDDITSPIHIKIQKWGEAIKTAGDEFRQIGIDDPNDRTKGYSERIKEIYQELLTKPGNIDSNYIEKHINARILISSPMPQKIKTVGGYGFTATQLEVLGSLPEEDLAAIGKTMSSGLRGSKLKQALFDAHGNLNRDWHFLVALHGKNTAWEQNVMREYYLYDNGGFETEEKIHLFFDSSEYLKTHPRLKKEMIEDALYWLNEGPDEEY
jgi:hypothetical protein